MSLLQQLTAATAGLSYDSIVEYIANRLRVSGEQDAMDSASRFESNLGLDKVKLMKAARERVKCCQPRTKIAEPGEP